MFTPEEIARLIEATGGATGLSESDIQLLEKRRPQPCDLSLNEIAKLALSRVASSDSRNFLPEPFQQVPAFAFCTPDFLTCEVAFGDCQGMKPRLRSL